MSAQEARSYRKRGIVASLSPTIPPEPRHLVVAPAAKGPLACPPDLTRRKNRVHRNLDRVVDGDADKDADRDRYGQEDAGRAKVTLDQPQVAPCRSQHAQRQDMRQVDGVRGVARQPQIICWKWTRRAGPATGLP